jgi:hypothetical protein
MCSDLVVSTLPTAWVASADLLIELFRPDGGQHTVVHDPATDTFVVLPGRAGGGVPIALSPDGRRMVLRPERTDGFGLCTLATGQTRWFPASGTDHAAAVSPAGDAVATLTTTTSGLAAVDLTMLSGPERRRLWSVAGGWTGETTISWSPDGSLIAATYNSEDDEWAAVILDADGAVVAHLPGTVTLPGPNGAWLDDRRLLCVDDDLNLSIVDVSASARTPVDHRGRVPLALVGRELVTALGTTPDGDTHLVARRLVDASGALDPAPPRPFLTVRPEHLVRAFDAIARSPLPPVPDPRGRRLTGG